MFQRKVLVSINTLGTSAILNYVLLYKSKIDLGQDQTNLVLSNYMIKKLDLIKNNFLLKHSGSAQNILDLSKIVYYVSKTYLNLVCEVVVSSK